MCGILGVLPANDIDIVKFTKARDSLFHRGPNAGENWLCPNRHILLGHRRLAILDPSPAGAQPMHSACGKLVMVFNGEIYNHLALREELAAYNLFPNCAWRGHSDTETLIACFSAWGVEATLKKMTGMFALAVWDREKKTIFLARDRIGEKPLYYGIQHSRLVFSSELKAFKHLPGFEGHIDYSAASLFLHNNYIPAPHSIYKGIFKLPPGTWIEIPLNQALITLPNPIQYWSVAEKAVSGFTHPFTGTFQDACDELDYLLKVSIKSQLAADVPIGVFLSGGIDSSIVASLMQEGVTQPITSLSIGVPGSSLDESPHAAAIAKHLGTNHIELHCKANDALSIIPNLSTIWDEPFGDSSQLPTWLVCKLAKEHVTVALSGDGGDEFFFGYPHYSRFSTLWNHRWLLRHMPWRMTAQILEKICLPESSRRLIAYGTAWQIKNPLDFIDYLIDLYRDISPPMHKYFPMNRHPYLRQLPDMRSTVALRDSLGYLPDDILVKVDRAAMSVSLETRAPLLDHRIVEFALSLPPSFKHQRSITKRILREILSRRVPRKLIERPKQGFSVPIAHWLRNELKEWSQEMLLAIRQNPDFWDYSLIETMWSEHQAGFRDHSQRLWGVFALVPFVEQGKL